MRSGTLVNKCEEQSTRLGRERLNATPNENSCKKSFCDPGNDEIQEFLQ